MELIRTMLRSHWRAAVKTAILLSCGVGLGLALPHAGAAPPPAPHAQEAGLHRVVLFVDSDDERLMGHAISYSINAMQHFASSNQRMTVEIVASGAGITLFRADKSPLQQPLAAMRAMIPGITYSMCDSSKTIAERKEGHPISLIEGARLVPFGIGRVIDLQEAGWTVIHV